jgi:HAD domain in Swiss Army Knife RNA repair proteins
MAIIFIDFDGVLNSTAFFTRNPRAAALYRARELVFDPLAMTAFSNLVRKTRSVVIISSDWRKAYDYDVIARKMQQAGFRYPDLIAGQIPNFGQNSQRGDEIAAWLKSHGIRNEPYAILDDRSDMTTVKKHLILTNPLVGLTSNDVKKAMALLLTERTRVAA